MTKSIPLGNRLRACRSFLLAPGSRPDAFPPGGPTGCDAVIVDLESTVAPNGKEEARKNALTYLWEPAPAGLVRIVRINSPRSALGLRDLLAMQAVEDKPDAIIIPKCESANSGSSPMCSVVRRLTSGSS